MSMASANTVQWHRPVDMPKSNWLPSAVILTIVFVSFRPFASGITAVPGAVSSGGDIVNQIGFGLLGIFCAVKLVRTAALNAISAFITPTWIFILVFLMLSVFSADAPNSAIRAMLFSLIVIFAAATALALPRNMDEMVNALAGASLFAVVFCYIAVIFVPEQGIHGGAGYEPQHDGLWKGVYDHKNVASYIMAAFAMIGWFVARNGKPLMGAILCALSVVFVLQSGSKTVLGVLPAAFATAALARWVSWGFLKAIIVLLPVVALMSATLGAVIYPPILEELQRYIPGLSYTGRTDLWTFGLQHLEKSPWLGYGYESFWNTPRVINLEQPIELSWDVRGIVHGHNSWLDAAIGFGIPGAIVITWAFLILPIRDYLRIPNSGNAGKLASFFIGLWILTALGANLESFFFRRADPVWFCMLIAVLGLRLTAHMSRENKPHHTTAPLHTYRTP